MRSLIFVAGAALVVGLSLNAAEAKKGARGNDDSPPSWSGTSPPGFSQGDKTWRNGTPPGWSKNRGNKRGWNGQSTPPGLYKRQ
jgi:hypothetical protein